ncbi:unnamed protein product, partial [Candidula unifasciata]
GHSQTSLTHSQEQRYAQGYDPVYVNRAALLPAYRPTPDYDAIMQQRIIHQHNFHQNMPAYRDEHGNYANVDELRNFSHSICANIFQENVGYHQGRGVERGNNLAVHPTYSSPELNSNISQQEAFAASEFSAQEVMAYHFRLPPPYPRTSSSTPDLAVQPASNLISNQPDLVLPNLTGSHDQPGFHDLIIQSRLDKSMEDLSAFQIGPSYSAGEMQALSELAHDAKKSSSVYGKNEQAQMVGSSNATDAGNKRTGAREIIQSTSDQAGLSENDVTLTGESTSKLGEDLDDTSSEHSYSTFHAKESDDSSDEEGAKLKSAQAKKDSNIQIRMFTPQEAPPPSKFKEEATLRESFRRLKISRTSSLNKEAPGLRRSSLCGLKETAEAQTSNPNQTTGGTQQPQTPHPAHTSADPTVAPPEMEEILEQLGAPPPYPGKSSVPDLVSDVPDIRDTSLTPTGAQNFISQHKQTTFKRSSSLGMTSVRNAHVLPSRKDFAASRLKTNTLSLDTVVPVSKPGMILFNKDRGTSVLKTEAGKPVLGDHEAGSTRSLSNKGAVSGSEPEASHEDKDDASDNVSSLQDYSLGSDSDSDHDQVCLQCSAHMGPLKLAAMNGLTLSRSVVLSLMNDDSRAPTDDRRKMLESKISEGQVYAEFEQIPRKSETLECEVAKAPHNASRNRFKDVLPYDITRVKLTPRKDNPDGYINASHMKLTANDTKWLFIATQAPLNNTAVDFWQMIWENNVDVVAMLTPFEELGKSKCFVYWPQERGAHHKQVYGECSIILCCRMELYLTSNVHYSLFHLEWFLDEIEAVARLAETEAGRSEKSPVVVHCSAGVGRTGVVILTMVMKWCLEHNHNVDLPKALSGIRSQRMHMVQTMGQYRFIHDTLIQYLKNTRLI